MKKRMLSVLAIFMCIMLCACTATPAVEKDKADDPSVSQITLIEKETKNEDAPSAPQAITLTAAADYDEVYKVLNSRNEIYPAMDEVLFRDQGMSAASNTKGTADMPMEAPAAEATAEAEVSDDYSGTNVQVKGIDEGDIVKCDGKYLYIYNNQGVIRIVEAAGENSREVSTVEFEKDWWDVELYIDNGRLIVLRTMYSREADEKSCNCTVADIYDVSDPSAPQKLYSQGQDGNYLTSRLMNGKLYLVSRHYVYYYRVENQDDIKPRLYVPCLYDDGEERVMEPGKILIPPDCTDSAYTVVSAIDVQTGERLSEQAVMGSSETVYMNGDNLYLAGTRYEQNSSEPYKENQYTVVDWNNANVTMLTRFSLNDGQLKAEATASVPGYLLNQFAMDEKDGNLRLVTTIDENRYSVYTDEAYDFTNYKYHDSLGCNALYIVDADLQIIGSIEDLAKDERVYSVRFDGDIGYFVTFRQMDPLFAVDLSDPAAPVILGELKIPGFSQYLHVYGDGLLFGLGQSTEDDESGRTDGMKLSMFDVSDPVNVSEIATLKLPDKWSEALYNHKAILILPEKNIIAFPLYEAYMVYGYDAEQGFYERAAMELDEVSWDRMRGVQIGDLFYVCTESGVGVYNLTDFTRVANIQF